MLVVSFVFAQIRRIQFCAQIQKFSSIVFDELLRCLQNCFDFAAYLMLYRFFLMLKHYYVFFNAETFFLML